MRWQYALNTEQYDIAQQLRNKLTEVRPLILILSDMLTRSGMACFEISIFLH